MTWACDLHTDLLQETPVSGDPEGCREQQALESRVQCFKTRSVLLNRMAIDNVFSLHEI